jgi:hypothetical protein|tara:strand:+ start:251 stop:481 length:231 start_codon:yes stop_codon:yes gene_type:complete
MSKINKFIKSKIGKDIISIMLGLGLAGIFKKSCDNRNCIIYKASKINNKLKYNNKCYNVTEINETCNPNKKIISFD